MATYTVMSDEVFMCCTAVGVVEVYELENLYLAPVKRKYWSHLGTLPMGVGKQYQVLKIGKKLIKGVHLNAVMQDLFDSRLMVNREGLCFLPAEGVNSDSGVHKVEYYRIFDRFNWEKYGVKVPLSTEWVCRDVLQGRPLNIHIAAADDDEVENEDNDDNHDACRQKLQEEEKKLEEEKRKHKELEEIVHERDTELVKKQEEIEELQKKKIDVSPTSIGLELYSFKHSNTQNVDEFYSKFAQSVTFDYPASKISVTNYGRDKMNIFYPFKSTYNIPFLLPLAPVDSVSSVGNLELLLATPIPFDLNNWRVLEAVMIPSVTSIPITMERRTVVFYDGKYDETKVYGCEATVSIPTSAANIADLYTFNIAPSFIIGIGPRYSSFIFN